jgi:hypothetical protein
MADKSALERWRAARRDLDANAAYERLSGITHETDTYLELNREVAKAEKSVPLWRRLLG